ncbi:TPA: polysaccharide biosynthesis/export family protein [Legionella pneumophila]|uniref:polysaccharide biosynthesis/export family protein n=1 Tax=Legionella pneumophila TaxID=446 RepID=UPI0005C43319|nr:polysaccharide biosynthesis/export family protein [Legionella pneumophila]HAT9433812.1 sugar ABC transporter substrate-binding protein [Legionella pneumophila subsp. pneumophila]MCK1887564.1 polysaccharide biosynthesis/export family protein [Legionella pneumophila]MCW8406546.1 polysaccharide biosynthesis/export family protein [Legionella pneumophila]RYB35699.1 sugar ABC transporter substrate-binding protein [Legionella pneumophila]RYB42972.1 sugar ABC transporter substrate-binding protein [
MKKILFCLLFFLAATVHADKMTNNLAAAESAIGSAASNAAGQIVNRGASTNPGTNTVISEDKAKEDSNFSSLAYTSSGNTQERNNNVKVDNKDRIGVFIHDELPIFGQNLFGPQCSKLHQARFFNPNYRIAVGDLINFQMWGAYQFEKQLTVDSQGNIFVPEVGPVRVEGIENSKLNHHIQDHVKKIFKRDVNIYADLVTAQPVQVYVTGFVNSPGLYDGLSSDSVIYFLCAADGINLREGSFRSIEVLRYGKLLRSIDLYDFILHGSIDPFQLHQGDTIVVKPQRYTIAVEGTVKNAYQYEWKTQSITMSELAKVVNIDPSVTFVRIMRNSGQKPVILYKPIQEARQMRLLAGDHLSFVADKQVDQILVNVQGQIKGHHQYVLQRGATLKDLMSKIELTPQANIKNIQLFRESVAVLQKEAINSSLARFERQVMTSTPTSDEDSRMQSAQSELIMKFVNEARQVKTQGQVVLGDESQWETIPLENNDTINVPAYTSVVTVSGDVVNAVSIEAHPGYRLQHYIQAAGGLNKSADPSQILLIKQNGRVHILKNSTSQSMLIEGGDQLIVLSKGTSDGLKMTGMLSKIAYQIAIAARVALTV